MDTALPTRSAPTALTAMLQFPETRGLPAYLEVEALVILTGVGLIYVAPIANVAQLHKAKVASRVA